MTQKNKILGLHVIITTNIVPESSLMHMARQIVLGKADSIQFRHKGFFSTEIYLLALELARLCNRFSIPFIVNDRVDIALAISASGVHLGQTDLPISTVRRLIGEEKLIGATASSMEQAQQAEQEGADYIGFGHVFATETKIKSDPPKGIESLKDVCKNVKIPLLAVGGINENNIEAICATGVHGIAVASAICTSQDPLVQTQKFKKLISEYAKKTIS